MKAALRRHWQLACSPVLIITILLTRNLPMSDNLRLYLTVVLFGLAGTLVIVALVQGLRLVADIKRDHKLFQENADRLRNGTWDMTGETDDTETMG